MITLDFAYELSLPYELDIASDGKEIHLIIDMTRWFEWIDFDAMYKADEGKVLVDNGGKNYTMAAIATIHQILATDDAGNAVSFKHGDLVEVDE